MSIQKERKLYSGRQSQESQSIQTFQLSNCITCVDPVKIIKDVLKIYLLVYLDGTF
jgi:hypothetical protein